MKRRKFFKLSTGGAVIPTPEGDEQGSKDDKAMKRREFLKCAGAGMATIIVGCGGGGSSPAPAPPPDDGGGGGDGGGNGGGNPPPLVITETLKFTITDAIKEMVTFEPTSPFPNPAECYFWVFKEDRFPAECPGPQIFAKEGDGIRLEVTNALDSPHAFFIPGLLPADPPMANTGPIAPGAKVTVEFRVGAAGTYLYYDNLNAPVNRMMGLHGAFIVMPKQAAAGHKLTPYATPSPAVQALFDDFGAQPWWPGLSWEAGDAATGTPPTRQHIWLLHQASPVLFEEVGLFAQANPGQDYPAAQFVEAFLNDPFVNVSNDPRSIVDAQFPVKTALPNRKPQYFTINGQSGHFSHNHSAITPSYRVGEPTIVRIVNAGLWTHSMHYHCNHIYVTGIDNVSQENPLWVDVFTLLPMSHVDYVFPYMRPPDVPNQRGIGRADTPLTTANGTPAWPPQEEFNRHHPAVGAVVVQSFANPAVTVDLAQRQSPLCYPMHDHSEPSQVAQGGNYNCGLIAGVNIIGDRNTLLDFPRDEDFQMMLDLGRSTSATGLAAGEPPE